MGLFAMEHGKAAYRADFGFYGTAVAALATFLFSAGSHSQRIESLALVWVGLASWTAIESCCTASCCTAWRPSSAGTRNITNGRGR